MAQKFDAYYKWFGIRPEDQPPDHYRLLGIQAFETDLDVISNAADQRMSHLRSLQNGPHSAESQRILNAVSKARVTLLDAEKKLAYDVALRKKIAAAAAASRSPHAAATPAAAGSPRFDSLDDLARDENLDLDDPAFEAALDRGTGRTPVAAGAGAARRAKPGKSVLRLASIACGSALGLGLAYALVANLAGVDPLGIFPRRFDTGTDNGDAGLASSPDRGSASAEGPTKGGGKGNTAAGQSGGHDSESDSPRVGPKHRTENDANGNATARPPEQGTRQPRTGDPAIPAGDPFAGFPAHVVLAAVTETSPQTLVQFARSPTDSDELTLLTDAAAVEEGTKLELVAEGTPEARHWRVQIAAVEAAAGATPVGLAELRIEDKSLTFAWQATAAEVAAAEQVQNCLLRFRAAEGEKLLRLRAPAVRPAHVLDFGAAASLVEIPLDAPPKPESLTLEIGPAEALSWGAEFKDERSRVRFVTPTKEKIVVMLGAITDADRPELAIEPQATRKGLQLRIVPRVVGAKGESPLSLPQIAEVRKKYSVLKIKTDRQWSESSAQKAALEKRVNDLERQIRSGGGQRVALQRELSRANSQLLAVLAAFKKVEADKLQFDGVLDSLGAAEHFIGELHKKGKVPYRVFATVGAEEIDLVRALE